MGKTMQGVAWATGVLLVAGLGVAVLAPAGGGVKASSSSEAASSTPASGSPASGTAASGRAASGTAASGTAASGAAASGSPASGTAAGGGSGGSGTAVGAPGPAAVGPSATAPVAVPADTVVRSGVLDIAVATGGFTSAFSAAATVARDEGGFVVTAEMGPGVGVADQGSAPTTVPGGIPDGVASVGPDLGQAPLPAVPASLPAPVAGRAQPRSGTLVLRIPGSKFDDARQRLEALGSLRSEQLSGQDAGGELADLGARLADLRAEQAGLRTMAANATSTDAQLQIQTQLAAVQQQIDGLGAQQATLQDQVALASLTVSVEEPAVAVQARSILSTRLAQAGHGVEAMLGGIIVVLAYAGPFAVIAGLAGLAWAGWRRRRVGAEVATGSIP